MSDLVGNFEDRFSRDAVQFTKFIDTNALYGSRRPEMKIDERGDFRTDRVNLYLVYYTNLISTKV